jgi:hypothetical protein
MTESMEEVGSTSDDDDDDDESIDSESTTGFDSVLPEILIYSYRAFKLSTKSDAAKKKIQDMYVKLFQLRIFQDKVRNEMDESTTTRLLLCEVVMRTLSIIDFKKSTNVDLKLIVRFVESRLALLILHHRFVSNLFIYSVIEDEGTIHAYYDGVSVELTTCMWLVYTLSKAIPKFWILQQAALQECNMVINYKPEFYPELVVLTDLIDKFVTEINETNPPTDRMLLKIHIRDTEDEVDC